MFESREGKKDISLQKRAASGLSWIWTLAAACNYHSNWWLHPEGREEQTRTTSAVVLSHLLGSDSPHVRAVQQRPSDNYSRQRDTRSRRLLGERAQTESERARGERWRNVPCLWPVNVIWSNVWQWAVGLLNVPWLHLHLSLHYIRIFWIVWPLLMQVSSFIHLTLEEETSDNASLH